MRAAQGAVTAGQAAVDTLVSAQNERELQQERDREDQRRKDLFDDIRMDFDENNKSSSNPLDQGEEEERLVNGGAGERGKSSPDSEDSERLEELKERLVWD